MKHHLYRDGQFIRTLDEDEDYIVKDKESIRASLNMIDSVDPVQRYGMQMSATPPAPMHRPGHVRVGDTDYEQRQNALYDRDEKLSNAWRDPDAPKAQETRDAGTHQSGTRAAADAAWERRNQLLEGAWR